MRFPPQVWFAIAAQTIQAALGVLISNQAFWIAAILLTPLWVLLGVQGVRRERKPDRAATPTVTFYPPRTDDRVPIIDGRTQPFVFGLVENRKTPGTVGVVGEKARLTLDFYEVETERPLFRKSLPGRWRNAPSVLERSPLQTDPDAETIDLHPNGTVYEFDLGTKLWTEARWYAIDGQQQLHDTQTKRARVLVTVDGSNFDPCVAEYFVQSDGYKAGFTASLLSAEEPSLAGLGYPALPSKN